MMVKVYFEDKDGSHVELVAVFVTEELYKLCLPHLEVQASLSDKIVTEITRKDQTINFGIKST